ncbi:hypothetical protein GCM10018962_77310 [Dactylosporangium matsuzakiense]
MTAAARPARTCRCACAMTHALPGRQPHLVCERHAVVTVETDNRAVLHTPMCAPCALYASYQDGARVESFLPPMPS